MRLIFPRAPIPWVRDTASKIVVRHMKHLGLYVFQRDALLEYRHCRRVNWSASSTRATALDGNGWKIRVAEVEHEAVAWTCGGRGRVRATAEIMKTPAGSAGRQC